MSRPRRSFPINGRLFPNNFYWAGKKIDQLDIFPQDAYQRLKIEMLLNTKATSVNPSSQIVTTIDNKKIHYGKLLIATGVYPIHLGIPGSEMRGIFYLRDIADAMAIKEAMKSAKKAIIIGGSFIGLELASSFKQMGLDVKIILNADALLDRLQTPLISEFLKNYYEKQGVEIIFRDTVDKYLGDGSLQGVLTASGKTLPCDLIALGIGVVPDIAFLQGSGIKVDNGILTDEFLQTNKPNIYAAGDAANYFDPVFGMHIRFEHWDNAIKHGRLAAKNMLGQKRAYNECSYFFSDIFDLSFEFFGNVLDVDEKIQRGSIEDKSFSLFYLKNNVPRALFTMGRPPQEIKAVESLIRHQVSISDIKGGLIDPAFNLEKISAQTVLILQGGGAMGAFECGAIKALEEAGITPDIIGGVSIGAFNAAIIAGNPDHFTEALESFWNDLSLNMPSLPGEEVQWFSAIAQALVFGLPDFFLPRWFMPITDLNDLPPNWISFYDPSPVRKLLSQYVDFSQLKKSRVRLLINAVNTETAELTTFDSHTTDLTVDHIMASGSLPPGFPWTTIDGKHYWDGGIISNSPLEQVIEHCGATGKKVFIIDLYPNWKSLPKNIAAVMTRRDEIAYAERIHKDTQKRELLHDIRQLIEEMLNSMDSMTAGQIKQRPHYIQLMGDMAPMTITRIVYENAADDTLPRDFDFSRQSITRHKKEGYRMARRALTE